MLDWYYKVQENFRMELNAGQIYFFIFCKYFTLCWFIYFLYTAYRIKKINGPCKELAKIKEEINNIRLILVAQSNSRIKRKG